MSEQTDFAQTKRLPDSFYVFHHVLDGVARRVFRLLRAPRAALIDKDQLIVPCQRQQVWQEIIVRRARSAVHDHQRFTPAEDLVVDHHAVGIHEAFLERINIGSGGFGGVWGFPWGPGPPFWGGVKKT